MKLQGIISFLGGLGLFIYGMHVMAESLQNVAGSKMKKLLSVLTTNKFSGVVVGALVTAIIQSSSATTVMVVGFVNAGLMTLSQSVGVIMGANIGTTITGWIVASGEWSKYLKPTTIAPIAIFFGAILVLFAKKEKYRQTGGILAGFGVLFLGMDSMTHAVSPLRDSEAFQKLFLEFGSNPLLGVLAGAAVTGIVQSSSASVGILQSLAAASLVPWSAAVYIIMGQNIGTCATALLSSIGASKNAKSAAYIHLLFNVMGSVIFSIIAVIYFKFFNYTLGNTLINLTEISLVHTSFNIANTVLLYNFSDILVKVAKKMANSTKYEIDEADLVHLDDRILETPSFAIESSIKEIVRLGRMALKNLNLATQSLLEKDASKVESVMKREKNIDALEQSITSYLVKVSNANIDQEEHDLVASLFHIVNDIERVGDHCENIGEIASININEDVSFSDTAIAELKEVFEVSIRCLSNSILCLENNSKKLAREVILDEQEVDSMEKNLRESHIARLSNNECKPSTGVAFLDIITNLERITDHSSNIAQMVIDKDF